VDLANLVGIVNLIFLLFGFQALRAFLERNSIDRWAFAGMVLSVIGLCLFFPFLAIFAFAAPVGGRFYLSGDPQAVNIISEATGTSNTAALARRRLRSILGFWGDSFLHGHLAIRKAAKMVGSCLRYLSPLELDPHYVPIVWLLGGILLFRSRDRNYTRHLESFRRTKVSYHIEPCPSTRNRPG